MLDGEAQLKQLKQRIAAIDRKYAAEPRKIPKQATRSRWFIEEWAEGQVAANEFGEHFQTERLFPRHKLHGSVDIGALADLPENLLQVLGGAEIPSVSPQRWAFLDTETTGLLGDSGTYAFLIGVGRITPEGFRIRQFFLREYLEERSVLAALTEHLADFDVLVTYNGKTYDQPLLEMRYRMARHTPPFARMGHVDLLHGARQLWKLRMESCRLVELEQQILGVCREGDLPGELIPYVYFEYLRLHEAQRLVPIFHHNAIDILTLACLTALVPVAFRDRQAKHGEDLAGIARWLLAAGEHEQALELLKRAIDMGLPDRLLFRSLWDVARLEKKLQNQSAALQVFTDLACCKNEYRVSALEELAKHYEHEERNYGRALEFTSLALEYDDSPALRRRQERLARRLKKT